MEKAKKIILEWLFDEPEAQKRFHFNPNEVAYEEGLRYNKSHERVWFAKYIFNEELLDFINQNKSKYGISSIEVGV